MARIIELRDAPQTPSIMKTHYSKVTNPENPKEFVYVETSLLNEMKRQLRQDGDMNGFFGDLWNGVKGAVGGFVASGGNPLGAVSGAISGVKAGKAPKIAVSSSANSGQASLTLTTAAGAAPAVVQPYPEKKDNTILYVGLGLAGVMLLTSSRRR